MLKKKSTTKTPCTSTASGGVLKCALEAGHKGWHSSAAPGKKLPQHAQWTVLPDGRTQVTTFARGKKQSDWFEAAPAQKADTKRSDARPAAQRCFCGGKDGKAKPHGLGEAFSGCRIPREELCECDGLGAATHMIGAPGCQFTKPAAPVTLEDEPDDPEADAAAIAAMDADDDDPLDDEIRSDEERDFARKMREDREAHAAELEEMHPSAMTSSRAGFMPKLLDNIEQVAVALGRGEVKVHPAADVFPMLEGEEYEALREDIRQNGVRVRPVLDAEGWLVDGRNRLRACTELGITPVFDRLPAGTDVVDFVISANLRRRHLNASQRAMFADAVANLRQGRQKQTGGTAGLTQSQAAQRFGVSERSVREARVVRESAAPEVVGAVEQGKLSVDAAAKLAKLPKDKQQAIYEREIKPKKDMVRGGKIKALTKQEEKRAVVRKINEQRVAPMPIGEFGVIYADYPWLYDNSDQHNGSRGHMGYPPMTMEQILAHAREAATRAAKDCIVALWVTNLYIPQIGRVLEAYGAEHRTMLTWPKPRAGVGTWPRGQTEHVVIASIGEPVHTLNEITTLLPSWNPAHPGEHSSKPAELAELLAKHCGGPFLELFGRDPRDGWTVWGAEVDKFAKGAA